MEQILYVDMDGTLAEFRPVPIAELYREGYFRNLAPQRNVIEAIRSLFKESNGIQKASALFICDLQVKTNKLH